MTQSVMSVWDLPVYLLTSTLASSRLVIDMKKVLLRREVDCNCSHIILTRNFLFSLMHINEAAEYCG